MRDQHDDWLVETEATQLAYEAWRDAKVDDRRVAFGTYRAALEREEHAGRLYAELAAAVDVIS
jgi:hypothetical protein